jgi:hypothetical protein
VIDTSGAYIPGHGTHPWSIGGGGAAELKELLDASGETRLGEVASAIGISAVTGEDELFMQPATRLNRMRVNGSMSPAPWPAEGV